MLKNYSKKILLTMVLSISIVAISLSAGGGISCNSDNECPMAYRCYKEIAGKAGRCLRADAPEFAPHNYVRTPTYCDKCEETKVLHVYGLMQVKEECA